ncbi:hypothetical protein HXX76_008888 [Chlamydomonas incerta]|uniref:type I protein arginine methyltransferase n=1 Tax=Chlamydomonas incerta TaxID=51695 RepID=A0A835SYT7_CHLIN|nr:hypothetical protein HXX76_008888 [Chlamydomonas incerta]|eukprot:KAG2432543.1 hypothetical protein HXX76_008888 [Chlamydomonas incerta]
MVAMGRQSLEHGKLDTALTILSKVVSQAPNHALAWFSLGRAHLLRNSHDVAAKCYHRAATLAASQRGGPANLLQVARDNMVLCGEKVLPRDWLPALQDAHIAAAWAEALQHHAAAAAAAVAATPQRDAALRAVVVGGLGLQALLLHALLSCHRRGEADATAGGGGGGGDAAAGGEADATAAGVEVTWVHGDDLSRVLAAMMAVSASVPAEELTTTTAWPDAAAPPPAAAAAGGEAAVDGGSADQQQAGGGEGGLQLQLVVAAGLCTARLALREWAAALAQARPRLAPGAALCPSAARLVGVLASSADLVGMNQVDLGAMAGDSGGLRYGPANELLWRPARSMQVSGFRYSLLSEPFLLLPEISAAQLMLQPQQVLGGGGGGSSSSESTAAATAAVARRHEVTVAPTAAGRADCVITWVEYELAPGRWLSYAPHELQGRADPPALSPHVWQRVQYLSASPAVQPGTPVGLQVTLSGGGNDVRVEYDEDVLPPLPAAGDGVGADADGGGGGLPAGEPLDGGSSSSDDEEEAGAAAAKSESADAAADAAAATAAAAKAQSGMLLPYHMSMLNDRMRTRSYAAGIRAAVAEAQAQRAGGAEPLVVLDVGAGTGLLSMMAARAGAEMVVGCERELALAVAAGALVAENELGDRVRIVQAHSKSLSVAPPPPPPPQPSPQDQPQPKEVGAAAAATAAAGDTAAASSTASATATAAGAAATAAPGSAGAAAGASRQLPARAGLVVHEIFGTDPLSEHILPSLAQVQESLAAPDAAFLPSAFRIVAALAHSPGLQAALRHVAPPIGLRGGAAGGADAAAGGLSAEAAARLERVLPAAAGAALQAWVPWKAEVDLMRAPDLRLLTRPVSVATLSLQAARPLPRAFRAAADAEPLPAPTPLAELGFTRCDPDGQPLPAPAAAPAPAASAAATTAATATATETAAAAAEVEPPVGNCVVFWFEADCGAGGWISTAPGSGSTYHGHWIQNVQFLPEPLPVVAPGLVAAGGLRVRISAECVMDRVRLSAEWAQLGDESSSSSSGDDE